MLRIITGMSIDTWQGGRALAQQIADASDGRITQEQAFARLVFARWLVQSGRLNER